MKYGIIDIGSNTFRLIISEITDDYFKVVDDLKETVRLGAGFDSDMNLSQEKINLAIKTLKMFKNYCELSGTDMIRAVATAAVRKSNNKDEFVNKVHMKTGLKVEVLSGKIESYFDYLGAVNSLNIRDFIMMDIGGGSTELALINDNQLIDCISIPFGSIDLANEFDLYDDISEKSKDRLEKYLLDNYSNIEWLKNTDKFPLVGIGGTIRNIAKIHKRSTSYPLNLIHNYKMDFKDVEKIYSKVSLLDFKGRRKIDGLSNDRADIFVGACGAVYYLMKYLNIDDIYISKNGVREGLMYEKIGYNKDNIVENPLKLSISNAISLYNGNLIHSEHINYLAFKLFEELTDVHKIKENISDIFYTACMLHDIGKILDYTDHHIHSFYIILNSIIKGLSHKKLLMSALIAGNHTHRKLKVNYDIYDDILSKNDIEIIKKLGLILKIAEYLDRSLSRNVKDIKCKFVDDFVIIKTVNNTDITLEINSVMSTKEEFKKIFNRKLVAV